MFANDSRKYEVRERMARNDWDDFLLNDFGLVTLISAYFKNEHVVLGISLVNSKVLDYFGENLEALS